MRYSGATTFLALFLAACSNNAPKPDLPEIAAVKQDSLEAPINEVPLKVTGVFLGNMPCRDCKVLHRMVNLQENYYTINEHHEGTTDKTKLLVQLTGKAEQDSGKISLFNTEGKQFQSYKIMAKDTIVFNNVKGKPVLFIRKDGQKIAQ